MTKWETPRAMIEAGNEFLRLIAVEDTCAELESDTLWTDKPILYPVALSVSCSFHLGGTDHRGASAQRVYDVGQFNSMMLEDTWREWREALTNDYIDCLAELVRYQARHLDQITDLPEEPTDV